MSSHAPALRERLADWVERGWLRRLDVAFSRFIDGHDPAASAPLLLGSALVAHLEGLGHSCLPLADLLDQPLGARAALLGWPEDASAALQDVLAALPRTVAGWHAALSSSPAVDAVGEGAAPLVLSDNRLYLRRYRSHERRVAQQVLQRCGASSAPAEVAEPAARARLQQWFGPAVEGSADWQQLACALALGSRLTLITGGPGTGKTHTAARLLALLWAMSPAPGALRVALAAPTGKAAARLKQSIDHALQALPQAPPELAGRIGPARTLHALLGARPDTRRFAHSAAHPLPLDLLIVDEASMVHLEMMAALLDALPPAAHLVLLGDKDQLASVEAGSVLADLCVDAEAGRYRPDTAAFLQRLTGQSIPASMLDPAGPALSQHTVMLRSSQRFGGEIAALAAAVHAGDGARATALAAASAESAARAISWRCPATPGDVVELACAGPLRPDAAAASSVASHASHQALAAAGPPPDAVTAAAHARWARSVLQSFDRMRVLCALRDTEWGVLALNRAIEQRLRALGLIGGQGEWYAGRPVMVLRNDPLLGVYNGDIGIALPDPGPVGDWGPGALRVWFADADGSARSVSTGRLREVETAFAMTVHKAQGSEFERVLLVLPPDASRVATREWLYTGVTRARKALTLISADPDALARAVAHVTRRASGLVGLLDGTAE